MTVSRYIGATARDAMRQVREALGEDAMIVSNRMTEQGVEILAMKEDALAALETEAQAPLALAAPGGEEVLGAIGALRGAIENRMDGMLWGESLRRAPVGIAVFRELLGAGFSTALARALADRLPDTLQREEAMAWVRNELANHLPVLDDDNGLLAGGGVFALVGPTGVGKTTTTAKLAARCVMKYGADRVAMLTTDGYRIGAHEQLLIYGRILGVPVLPAGDAQALQQALTELRGKHIVLIDTVGMSQRDQNVAEQAAMLCAAGRPVRRLLLLNSASHGDTLDEVAHAYRQDGAGELMGCIITKVDEATHLGAVLDTAIRHRLPVHYVCTGQKVPENLMLPRPRELVDRAFAAASTRALFAPTEADFAAMWSVVQERPQAVAPATMALQRARSRRNLHAAVAGGGGGTQVEFDQALAAMQQNRAFALAQQLWREHVAGPADAAGLADTMLADIRAHFSSLCERHLVAVHGRLRTAPPGSAKAGSRQTGSRQAGSILFSDRGEALASPVRHLITRHGVQASFDPDAAQPVGTTAQTPLARADWLAEQLGRLPLVHVFDGFAPTLAQHMQASQAMWLARCSAAQRVVWQDSRISCGALAKLLGHAPAGQTRYQGRACSRWVGSCEVSLSDRVGAEAGGALRLVSTRLLAEDSGECLLQLVGIGQVDPSVNPAMLAAWLEMADAAGNCNAWAQAAVEKLGSQLAAGQALAAQLLVGAQLGLAGWHLASQEPATARVLLGASPVAPGQSLRHPGGMIDSLIRLFAALEMMLEPVS